MNNDRRIITLLLIGVVAFAIVSGTKWFFKNYEKQQVESFSGYSKKAQQNKFLAAEYFLQELGYEVESDSNRARFLEPHTKNLTILINDYGPKLSSTHFQGIVTWIESGGHLIFTANHYDFNYGEENEFADPFKNNQLLDHYGITPVYTDYDTEKSSEEITSYEFNDGTKIKLDFAPTTVLLDTKKQASKFLKDNYGNHMLQLNIGEGKLTILSDNYLFSNDAIGENDHAYFLSLLSQQNKSENKKFLLLYNNQSDSIFSLIWKYGKEACIAFFAFLCLFLWSMRNRFGPIIPVSSNKHRNITEHLRALARFSWRQDHGVHLLNQSRLACENTLLKRYPTLKQMSTQERLEHISDILDLKPESVHSALYFSPRSTSEFIATSHNLQKIWILQ